MQKELQEAKNNMRLNKCIRGHNEDRVKVSNKLGQLGFRTNELRWPFSGCDEQT